MKKIYLDVCTLCRSYDNQSSMRIRMETSAYNIILDEIKKKKYELYTSDMLFIELNEIKDDKERNDIVNLLLSCGKNIIFDQVGVENRANYFIEKKFGVADAVHLAFAEQTSDYLITCDDKFIKKSQKFKMNIQVINPIDFCIKENLL